VIAYENHLIRLLTSRLLQVQQHIQVNVIPVIKMLLILQGLQFGFELLFIICVQGLQLLYQLLYMLSGHSYHFFSGVDWAICRPKFPKNRSAVAELPLVSL
jgi:hypothetical protein